LGATAQLAGWNTPRGTDGSKGSPNQSGDTLSHDATLTGWGTPTSQDAKHSSLSESEQKRDPNVLRNQAHLAGWATPIDRDWKDTEGMSLTGINPDGSTRNRMDHLGRQAFLSTAKTDDTGGFRLNPAFSLWLIAGDSVTRELIATCPRGLVPSRRRGTQS
jgi:hypothetical protein